NLGGQAFWSLGGIFLVNSPEQRRMGIKDSYDLALQDWMGSAGFDREREDHWPRQWAQAYVQFAAGEKRAYMHGLGMRFMPTVGKAGECQLRVPGVVVTSGCIRGTQEQVRRSWPVGRLGRMRQNIGCGGPAPVDGRMRAITENAGGSIVNRDRMWHYTEGIVNWDPIWPDHGIRIIPGPSSLWLDAEGTRLPTPLFPGFDTLGTLKHILGTGHDHTWLILTQSIIEKEFALSGSEQNPDMTGKDLKLLLGRVGKGATGPVDAFMR